MNNGGGVNFWVGGGRRKRLSGENFKLLCSDTRKQGILATTGSCLAGESNKQEVTGENRRLGNFQWIEIETCLSPKKKKNEREITCEWWFPWVCSNDRRARLEMCRRHHMTYRIVWLEPGLLIFTDIYIHNIHNKNENLSVKILSKYNIEVLVLQIIQCW